MTPPVVSERSGRCSGLGLDRRLAEATMATSTVVWSYLGQPVSPPPGGQRLQFWQRVWGNNGF